MIFQWKIRELLAGLLLVLLGVVALFFVLAGLAERALATERRVGGVSIRVYQPSVTPLLALKADSVVLRSEDFRLTATRPRVRIADWIGMKPSSAALILKSDSLHLDFAGKRGAKAGPVVLPAALRFPLATILEWRVLTIRIPGLPEFSTGSARWQSRGSQAMRGNFRLRLPVMRAGESAPELDAVLNARWRGPALRYRLEARDARHAGALSLLISGIREKNDLRAGFDSVDVFAARPDPWLPEAWPDRMPAPSQMRVAGRADWRTDSLRVVVTFLTAAAEPLESASWNIAARLGNNGGRFMLRATGAEQSLQARGKWSHPGSWISLPAPETWRGEFSGAFHGGVWKLGRARLPLEFEVPLARLDTGLLVSARLLTPEATRVDVRWSGRRPGRLELSGDVSPVEPWALAWTGDNVAYGAARVEAAWEDSRLKATAHVRAPRAYGALADSLVAVNEVTGSGYFLRAARIYSGGEVFTGSGEVLWRSPAGAQVVSLRFGAGHKVHGHATIAMQFPGALELTADSLWPARFPHEFARRLAAYDPRVHGRFVWNHRSGDGEALLDAVFTGSTGRLEGHLDAIWQSDSLRVRNVTLATGESRLGGTAVLPFDGRTLTGLWGVQGFMGGAWRVQASRLNPADVWTLAGRTSAPFSGIVNGDLAFSPAGGLRGEMLMDSLRFHAAPAGARARPPLAPHENIEVTGITLKGMGDSLRFDALLSSRGRPAWSDTVEAVFARLNSENPVFRLEARSPEGLSVRVVGEAPAWRMLRGDARVAGAWALPGSLGRLNAIDLRGRIFAPLNRNFLPGLGLEAGTIGFRHIWGRDTMMVSGTTHYEEGVLRIPDLTAVPSRGGSLKGSVEASTIRRTVSAELRGVDLTFVAPGGESLLARELTAVLTWDAVSGLTAKGEARDGQVALPPGAYRAGTGFDVVRAEVSLPPEDAEAAPRLFMRGRLHDFNFERKWGWRDATAFFTAFNRRGARPPAPGKRARPWELDLALEAAGTRNRVDTDVLRMNFTGDARMTGAYPYTLISGKISGLQGEIGQVRQSFVLRDFEVKWDNVTLEDGTIFVEGEKKVRTDCRDETRQTCQIYVRLDGRLEEVGFAYETDCGQNSGEPVPPSVLINSMAQGCYVSEEPGGEGSYGGAAIAMLEPAINARLSREFARGSGGFIKSTQVSGLSALIGSDSSGLESVSLEVESRSVRRVSLKGRAGYHPETKLANPMEYRMAAEYRPPLERFAADSAWQARLKGRFTVEAAVETRPEGRDIEEERRVRQRAGLRYRHRFWNLW